MKAWLLLFSVWILVCAGMPCADLCTDDSHAREAALHVPFKEPVKAVDFCSPFCICYCCAVTSELPQTVSYFSKPVLLGSPASRYLCPPAEEPADPFWQPPRSA